MNLRRAFPLAVAFSALVATGRSSEPPANRPSRSLAAPAAAALSNLVQSVRSFSDSAPPLKPCKLEVKEVSLGRIPGEMLLASIPRTKDEDAFWQARAKAGNEWFDRVEVSPDQKRVAIVIKRDGKSMVLLEGKEGPAYDAIVYRPRFSPDSRRLAYAARRGGEQFVVVDGAQGKGFEPWRDMYPIFSPDSRRVAYMARRGGKVMLVIDGVEGKSYRSFKTQPPPEVFSPDSTRYAYAAELSEKQWVLVVDGREGKTYDYVREHQFSPDSQRVLYVAGRQESECVVVDGVEDPVFESVSLFSSVGSHFSPDSRRVAYTARARGLARVMVVDGKPGKEYDEIEFRPEIFSADSQHAVYTAGGAGSKYVVVDEKEGPSHDRVDWFPRQSPDGKRMAYVASRGGDSFVVLDGQAVLTNGFVGCPMFSPDSRHVAFSAVRGLGMAVIRDGKEGPTHTLADLPRTRLVFSPDSQRLAYNVSLVGKAEFVVLDGARSKLHEFVASESMKFSPDSQHLAYWAAPFTGKWHVCVDGQRTAGFDERLHTSTLAFDGPDSLHALALKGDEIVRLEIKIIAPPP